MHCYTETKTLNNNNYLVRVEVIPNLYKKLTIFENSIDVTNKIRNDEALFNKLLGSLSLHKLHHTTPKFVLANWKNEDDFFHEININKNNSKIDFNTVLKNDKKNTKKYLHPKFSSLHKYTFNFENYIIIFEGHFINLVEKYIDGILNYIEIIKNNYSNIKIKDIIIDFPEVKINYTDNIVKNIINLTINKKKIHNIRKLNVSGYNRVISEIYMKILFLYTSIEDNELFFKKIYSVFETNIPIIGLEGSICSYFSILLDEVQKIIISGFGINYVTGYIEAPSQYSFPVSEIWKIQTIDENKKFNSIIPITPKYAILISSDIGAFDKFKKRISGSSSFIDFFINAQINIIRNLTDLKYKELPDHTNGVNSNYTIFCGDEKTHDIIKKYVLRDYIFSQYMKNKESTYNTYN